MDFFSNVLNSIPVVGHVKGVVHYVAGDTEGGHKAMYQATRTSAVLGGGAVGCLAGPGGAIAGAVYAGLATDGVASIAMDKPQGIVMGCKNIANDIEEGNNPAGSILSTGFQIGMDAVGGLGMGGVSSAASQVSEKAVAKTVENVAKKAVATVGEKAIQKTAKVTGEEVVKMVTKTVSEKAVKKVIESAAVQAEIALVSTHVAMQANRSEKEEKQEKERKEREERDRRDKERRERDERDQRDKERREKEDKNRKNKEEGETGSGPPQPPKGNRNNKSNTKLLPADFFKIFKDLLDRLLKRIPREASRTITSIFLNLSCGQIEYFANIIERLMNCGILEEVITIVITIFAEHFPRDISFPNFLSMLEFVAAYITEEISDRTTHYRMRETISRQRDRSIPTMDPEVLEATILSELMVNLRNVIQIIVDLFRTLQNDIERETARGPISPNFRDTFSAVYHYFKHRRVPGDGVLSVKEYYDWIRRLLREVKGRQRYRDLLERQRTGNVNGTVVCDVYVSKYGRRFRIVVKFYCRTTVLSSCFVLDIIYEKDNEGDIFVNYYFK